MNDPILRAQIEVLRHNFSNADAIGKCVHAVVKAAEASGVDPCDRHRTAIERLARELVDIVRESGNQALRGGRGAGTVADELNLALVALDLERERQATEAS